MTKPTRRPRGAGGDSESRTVERHSPESTQGGTSRIPPGPGTVLGAGLLHRGDQRHDGHLRWGGQDPVIPRAGKVPGSLRKGVRQCAVGLYNEGWPCTARWTVPLARGRCPRDTVRGLPCCSAGIRAAGRRAGGPAGRLQGPAWAEAVGRARSAPGMALRAATGAGYLPRHWPLPSSWVYLPGLSLRRAGPSLATGCILSSARSGAHACP